MNEIGKLETEIGTRIRELLNLKIKGGMIQTSRGTKTDRGLGACIKKRSY